MLAVLAGRGVQPVLLHRSANACRLLLYQLKRRAVTRERLTQDVVCISPRS